MESRIEDCKRKLMTKLHAITDLDALVVECKNKSSFLQTRSQRGSRYRGVSKNGSKWQVMIVRGDIKKYIGAVADEEVAARLYDKYALIIQGFEVRIFLWLTDVLQLIICARPRRIFLTLAGRLKS